MTNSRRGETVSAFLPFKGCAVSKAFSAVSASVVLVETHVG